LKDKRIIFPSNGKGSPRKKYFKSEREEEGQCATNWWSNEEFGDNAAASKEIADLFGTAGKFDNPKPVELVRGVIQVAGRNVDVVMDFFAGSGTTAHSALRLEREDGDKRFFLLMEIADYFGDVVLPRIKKVAFCEEWKDGKPVGGKGISQFVKYHMLEQYEDALNNLELPREKEAELALKSFEDDYLLRYMLEFETAGSASLLSLERLRHPFNYKLKVQEGDEVVERVVDLVETFNYLLGLQVKKLREFRNGERLYRATLGEQHNQKIAVVVWRDLDGLDEDAAALRRDAQFIENTILPALLGTGSKPDRLLVNGAFVVDAAEPIEPELHRLMFAPIA
jgi:adenine-specific DNA-methyltransferase